MKQYSSNNPNPITIHTGKVLRELRKSRKISQTVVADSLGCKFQMVQKLEKGTNRITLEKLYVLCELFEVDANYFMQGYKK